MTAYDTILDALRDAGMKVKETKPGQARSQCPGHGSDALTLSIRRSEDGAKVKCFAGCETPGVLEHIGLALRDLYDNPGSGTRVPAVTVLRPRDPWVEACRGIAVTDEKGNTSHPIIDVPDLDHVLDRMVYEQAKEAAEAVAGECIQCFTRPSPWSCCCGLTRVEVIA